MAIKGRAQKTLTKIFDGSGVFSIIITNENTSIPISNQGLALNYSATPTDAYVYSGTSILTPVKSNPEAGQYTISVDGENITPGIVSMNGNHASIGNASNMVSNKDSYSINITASGKDFLGNPFTSQKKQVITPLKRGDDATSYWLNVTSSVITKDVKNNMTPSDVTVSSVAQSGFSDPREYNAIFKVYYKTGIEFSSTPSYTSSSPETSYKITPDSNVNDIKIEMYDEGNTNLLDVQTVPVISQANGVISTKIVYTVTNTAVQPNDSANWSDTMPTVGKGQYLWTKTTFYYTDGSNAVAYSLGSVGKDGSSAALLTLVSDSQVFTFKSDNVTPSPASQVINFVANLQNVTGTATFVATPYLGSAAGTPIVLGGTGNARTLTVDQFGKSYDSVVVKATLGALSDTETIHKLKDGYDGTDGKNGTNGVQGPKGADGKSSYVHIAYANSADGSKDFSTSVFSGKSFIGIYTDEIESDSTDYKNYTWSLVKGTDGKSGSDGAQGPKGSDGKTSYVHVAYASSADGNTGFSTTDPSGKAYIGVLTDFVEQDSTDPNKYTWSLAKGADGEDGSDGLPGPKGADGISTYVHFAYANSADGSKDFSTTAYAGKLYIGTLTDTTVADSTDYKKYTWSLIKGADGKDGSDGLPGPKGADGISTYVHFAYANSADGSKDFSTTDYTGRSYIGNLTDTTQADSTDYKKYTWSLVKGADGKDSLSGWLTNEAITVQADSNGNVPNFSTAKGTFVVYNGTSPVTGLTITQSNATGMTVSITGMDYSVTGMSQDSGYVDLIAKTAGVTITKRLTVAKSKAGATGENGTSVVNSTTPPKNPDEGQWWNDLSVTPNILKVYQKGQWVPYRIDAINLVANSITTDQLASSVLKANNIIYTNSNGTTTNLQTFDFDGIKTLLTDTNGNTYSNMESAVGSTKVVSSLQKQVNDLGQVNQLINTEFSPDFSGWYDRGLHGKDIKASLGTPRNGSNVITKVDGSPTRLQSEPIAVTPGMKVSYSVNKLSSITLWSYLNCSDKGGNIINVPNTSSNEIVNAGRNNTGFIKIENITIPDGVYYISLGFLVASTIPNGDLFQQPMLVFSGSVGAYVPGQYNNNERLLKIEESADKFQISIGKSVKDAQNSADSANTKVDNLSVGGRNYLYGTSYPTSIVGNNTTNQGKSFYKITLNSLDSLYQEFKKISDYYTLAYDWVYTGTNPSGKFVPQWNMSPWGLSSTNKTTTLSTSNTSGTCVFTDLMPTNWSGITGLPFLNFRLDNVPPTGTLTISNVRLIPGNKNYPWTIAPEDTTYDGRNLIQNSQSLNFTVGSNTSTTTIKSSFDSNTNMWHITSPKGGSNNAGIYFSESAIKNGYPWTLSYDIKGTGSIGAGFGTRIEGSTTVSDMSGTVGSDWSRVSVTGYSVQDSRAVVIYFDSTQQALDVYIKLPKLEIGTKATPWSIAPEDLANGIANAQSSADTANLGVAQSLSSNLVVNSEFDNSTGSYTGWHMASPWGVTVTSQISKNGNKTKADSGSYLYPSPSQMMVHDITNNGDWIYSDPIPVGASQPISGSLTNANPSGATTNVGLALYVYAYDANKNRISAIVGNNLTSVHGNWVVNSFENKLTPANTAYISFCFGWNNGKGYFGQPMLQASSKYTGYIPGTPNSNLAIANAQTSADTANSNINNLSVGGRNLLLGTRDWGAGTSLLWKQRGTVTTDIYRGMLIASSKDAWSSPTYVIQNAGILQVGKTYTFSTYVRNTSDTDTKVAPYYEGGIVTPIGTTTSLPAHTDWFRVSITFQCTKDPTTSTATLRWEGQNGLTNGSIQFAGYKLEEGNKATDWTPAPEDVQSGIDSAQTSADTANNNLANASKSGIRYLRFRSEGNTDNASTHFSEISIYSVNGANLLSNKSAVMVGGATTSSSLTAATDGNYSTYLDLPNIANGEKYAMYDLGSVRYDVENISVAMYSSTRTYYNVTVQTSVDNVTWSTIYRGNITPNQLINGVVGTNISFGMDTSTVLKLTADNYTLGIDANGNLISGITGNTQQVTLKGNVIHLDGNTVAGPDFFSLWNGKYGSTTIDSTGMEVRTGLSKTKFTNGNMQFITDLGENIGYIGRQVDSVHNNLDYLTFGLNGWHTTYPGDSHYEGGTEDFYGGDGILFGISNADGGYAPLLQWNSGLAASYKSSISGWLFTQPIVGGIDIYGDDYASNKTVSMRFQNVKMSNGFTYPIMTSQQAAGSTGIVIGSGSTYMLGGNSFVWSVAGNGYAYYNTQKRGSSGSSLLMASDGAIIAQTSATKYKSDIEYEPSTSYGDKLLTIDPATWSDKNEKEQIQKYKDTGQEPEYSMNKDGARYYGLIAEDMVKAGLEDLIVRNTENGSVEGIQYEKIGIALIPLLREQRNQINELRVEIERLKEKNNE